MSLPKTIESDRRRSIVRLTRSPMSVSPSFSLSPSRQALGSGSFSSNTPFIRHSSSSKFDDAIDSQSSHGSSHAGKNTSAISDDEANIPPSNDTDFSYGIDDPKLLETVSKHLKNDNNEVLLSEGGDITREIYRLGNELRPEAPRRSKSFGSVEDHSSRRGSFASSLNVPGGFRRDFIVSHASTVQKIEASSFLSRNFVEFLSIYGHFAGENLEDEDAVACHYKPILRTETFDEQSPLIGSGYDTINPRGTATDRKAFFLLLKAFVGTGVLFLPKAFSNGGLLFSVGLLLIFGLLSFWCYLILVYSKIATKKSSFGEIGLTLYGNWLQRLILFSIVISQIGFVAAYIVFTAENIKAFISNVSGWDTGDIPIHWFIVGQVVILVPLSLIRDITKLSLLALMANIFIFVGLVTILYYTFYEFLVLNKGTTGEGIHYFFNQSEFSLFIGVAIFAFEGVGLIIPIQESMIYPEHFPKVLFLVVATISSIFIFIGGIGYLTFGRRVQTVVILNLPQESPLVILIQLLYAFAILLSTPIQLFPAIRLVELKLFRPSKSGKNDLKVKWLKNITRSLFVIVTAVIALYGGRNLDRFVSFVGCFACIPLVYMYPPLLHLKSCCDYSKDTDAATIRKKQLLALLDYFLVLIGGVAMVYTTYSIVAA